MKKPRKPSPAALKKKASEELRARLSEEEFRIPAWEVFEAALKIDARINPEHPDLIVRNPDYYAHITTMATEMLEVIEHRVKKHDLERKLNLAMDSLLEKWEEVAVGMRSFSSGEKKANHVSFRRGCQLITGLKDPRDAERRFLFALQHIRVLKRKPFEHYRDNGFTLGEVVEGYDKLRTVPKNKLRKPYERTGLHRRNKQGRKKNPKK